MGSNKQGSYRKRGSTRYPFLPVTEVNPLDTELAAKYPRAYGLFLTFGDVLLLFMRYCAETYGEEMIISRWLEFCSKYQIERFTEKAIDAAFDDPKLKDETVLFARDIGELARQTA